MSVLRDIWTDLVDKRLWPIAVALVLALVAIPTVMLQPAAKPKAPPPMMADAGPAPLVADPASVQSARPSGPVLGEAKNPFDQKHVAKQASSDGAGAGADAGAGPGTTDSGSAPSVGGTTGPGVGSAPSVGGAGPSIPRPRRSEPAADEGPSIKVRFGPTEGKRKVRVLSAGKALPSASNPTLVFVDVARGGKIEFLVSSDAVPQGDGICKPTKDICAQLFMRAGDTEFLDVTRASGEVVQYQLDVLDVTR